ncbi:MULTISPECIES: Gfo/Idh/MocA family protein [unclassified Paenibacillus]|uniref:Gfo/Idh/MocA family protein n=1 Tax=unclassified Paenibacillus TaxID=185978 RepID=UPI00362EFBC6
MNFAIVGCGHIAKKHVEAILLIEGAQLVAVCDTNESRLIEYIDAYGVAGYTKLSEMLLNPEIDVVNICTPSGLHAPLAVQVANAGKHVIVEKPIALTLEDADLIINACQHNQVKLSVVHPNRFRPAVIELKKAMDSGSFGKLSHANATVRWNRNQEYYDKDPWRGTKSLDGGVLMNQAIHNLDLLTWIMGDVKEVSSFTATRLRNIEADDVAVGIVRFENGALGVIEAAVTIYPKNLEETLSVFGDLGTVKIAGTTISTIEHWNVSDMNNDEVNQMLERIKHNPLGRPGHQCIIEDMIKAIQQDRQPMVNGEDGKKALKLILALYSSAEDGGKTVCLSQQK